MSYKLITINGKILCDVGCGACGYRWMQREISKPWYYCPLCGNEVRV